MKSDAMAKSAKPSKKALASKLEKRRLAARKASIAKRKKTATEVNGSPCLGRTKRSCEKDNNCSFRNGKKVRGKTVRASTCTRKRWVSGGWHHVKKTTPK